MEQIINISLRIYLIQKPNFEVFHPDGQRKLI